MQSGFFFNNFSLCRDDVGKKQAGRRSRFQADFTESISQVKAPVRWGQVETYLQVCKNKDDASYSLITSEVLKPFQNEVRLIIVLVLLNFIHHSAYIENFVFLFSFIIYICFCFCKFFELFSFFQVFSKRFCELLAPEYKSETEEEPGHDGAMAALAAADDVLGPNHVAPWQKPKRSAPFTIFPKAANQLGTSTLTLRIESGLHEMG